MPGPDRIERFRPAERVIHWLVALSFLYVALTGLALWSPRLYWLAAIFGGGSTVSRWHPWGALLFVAAFAAMFRLWRRQMRLDSDDRFWLRHAHRFILHKEYGILEAKRFNGGQKMLFWIQALSGVSLLASGLVLWWPELTPRALRVAAVLIHPLAALVSIGGIIVHIYMATAAVPGALRGMIQGWVTDGWARSHHAKWHRELRGR